MNFFSNLLAQKFIIYSLVINDFKKEYIGSYLGVVWAFLQPLMMVAVLWFVFEVGFRRAPSTNGVPFILWLTTGMFAWFYFISAVSGGTKAIVSNGFIIKKLAFNVSLLPVIKILSSFIIHFVFIIILIILFLLYGIKPSIYWLQLPYYTFAMIVLIFSIVFLTSALQVFVKDIGNFIAIVLQAGFWFTPIFWSIDKIPQKYLYIIKANPMNYIVQGYRDSFINHKWFFEDLEYMFIFWFVTLVFLFFSVKVFKKLRPHFGDVL